MGTFHWNGPIISTLLKDKSLVKREEYEAAMISQTPQDYGVKGLDFPL